MKRDMERCVRFSMKVNAELLGAEFWFREGDQDAAYDRLIRAQHSFEKLADALGYTLQKKDSES